MRTLLITLLLFCMAQNAMCQVSGKLVTDSNRTITFANVLLLKSTDSAVIKTALSNDSGAFKFVFPGNGKYLLRLESLGYQSQYSPVFELSTVKSEMDFGTILMKLDNKKLEGVVIRSVKPLFQQQPGGLVVNVENSLLTKGSTALQALERSPGVVIDHRNNSIALNGKDGVMVMFNGKLIPMQMDQVVTLLSSMSADDIEKIELLTTPPAKYDAAGNAGLINIVLKKNKKLGTNGTVSVTGGYGFREKGTGNISLSHNQKNTDVSLSYTLSNNKTYSELFITGTQDMPFLGGKVAVIFYDTTNVLQNNHTAIASIDRRLNSKVTVGAMVNFIHSGGSGTTLNNAGYNILPDSVLQFTGQNKGDNSRNNLVNSVYFEKTIREGEKINLDLDYLYFNFKDAYNVQSAFINKHGEQAGENNNLFSPQQKGFAKTGIQVGVAKLNYTKQISKAIKLETGAKGTYTQSSSISGIQSFIDSAWTNSDQTSNDIVMKESLGAAYASINAQVGVTVSLTAGIRYEYSYTHMDNGKSGARIIDRKLGSLFPSMFLSKKINDRSELQLSYTKRISRPSYNDLASYVAYSDPTAVYTGNPFLKPTITHNLKLGYNYKNYAFSVLFSRDVNPIQRYQLTESPAKDMLFISPQNLEWQNTINLQANVPVKVKNWWLMNYSLVGGLRQFKGTYTIHPFQKTYIGYSFNFSETFTLPKSFSAEVSGSYNSTSYNGTTKVGGFGILNAGIKKELNNNKGFFQLSVSDILRNEIYRVQYGTFTREAFFIKSNVAVITESAKFPIIRLTYSRSFGTNLSKAQRKAAGGSQEEIERVRSN